MALTTPTSELPYSQPTNSLFFGRRIPSGILTSQLFRDHLTDKDEVRWRIRNDPTIYSMPFEHSDEGVMAVLAAMKLTC